MQKETEREAERKREELKKMIITRTTIASVVAPTNRAIIILGY